MKRLVPYWMRIEARRAHRWITTLSRPSSFAHIRASDDTRFPVELVNHTSKLVRKVDPQWQQLQENKIRNLELACTKLDRLIIEPGEVFSFCHVVGRTSRSKGYVEGLEMHQGELIGAPGGGLCQMANLLFWMAIHLDFEILERHRHETDLFPDDERRVPFGMGATVFYNYRDLQFRNTLTLPVMLRVSVERPNLCGAFYSSTEVAFDVKIIETAHRFFRRDDGTVWRENRVAKRVTYHDGRAPVETEIAHNLGQTCYEVPEEQVE